MTITDPATLERLKDIGINDVELSVRSLNALKKCGVSNLHEAQTAVVNRQLHNQYGVGRKTVNEVKEIIWYVMHHMPPSPKAVSRRNRVELNSLLLAYETHVLALYTYQRGELDNSDFSDINLGVSIYKRKAAIESVREKILAYVEQQS